MARPQLKGLSYFPFDVAFFSDKKIKIVKSKYGADGVMLYIYLLCAVYNEGYYLKTDDDFNYIAAADLGMTDEKIGQILNFLLGRSLFNDKLFKSDKVLTSHGIQSRFQEAVKGKALKKAVQVNEKFWLLSEDETQSFIEVRRFDNKSEINPDKSEINPDKSEINDTKESKLNKSKLNDTKPPSGAEVQAVYNLFNKICTRLNPVSDHMNYSREKETLHLIEHYDMDFIASVFAKANTSEFMCGNGPKGWKADYDWIINRDKFVVISEGKYDNRGSPEESKSTSYDIDDINEFWNKVPTL